MPLNFQKIIDMSEKKILCWKRTEKSNFILICIRLKGSIIKEYMKLKKMCLYLSYVSIHYKTYYIQMYTMSSCIEFIGVTAFLCLLKKRKKYMPSLQ